MVITHKQLDERFGWGETLKVEFLPREKDKSDASARACAYNSRYPLAATVELATLILHGKKYYPWASSFKVTGKDGGLRYEHKDSVNA